MVLLLVERCEQMGPLVPFKGVDLQRRQTVTAAYRYTEYILQGVREVGRQEVEVVRFRLVVGEYLCHGFQELGAGFELGGFGVVGQAGQGAAVFGVDQGRRRSSLGSVILPVSSLWSCSGW